MAEKIVNTTDTIANNVTHTPFSCDSTAVVVTKTVFLCFIFVLSLVGNMLVVLVVYRKLVPRSAVTYFILNMAISDLVVPMVSVPAHIVRVFTCSQWLIHGVIGTLLCKFLPFVCDVSTAVSTFTMVAIAVDRFHSIMFPMKTTLISIKKSWRVVAFIWILAAAVHSFYFYIFKVLQSGRRNYKVCTTSWNSGLSTVLETKIHFLIIFLLTHGIPFTCLTVLYSGIVFALYRQKVSLELARDALRQRAAENRKVTYMLLTVVVVFGVTWLPYSLYGFFMFFPEIPLSRTFYFIVVYAPLTYSAINPLIYYFFNEKYRKGFRQILLCGKIGLPLYVRYDLHGTSSVYATLRRGSGATASSCPDNRHNSLTSEKNALGRSVIVFGTSNDNGSETKHDSV